MHEISVLEKVVKLCREKAEENNIEHIKGITLAVGELSGFIPYFFTEYFPIITKDEPLFVETELTIKEIRGEALCKECHSMYKVVDNEGACPRCGSRVKTIVGGQEFRLEQLAY